MSIKLTALVSLPVRAANQEAGDKEAIFNKAKAIIIDLEFQGGLLNWQS